MKGLQYYWAQPCFKLPNLYSTKNFIETLCQVNILSDNCGFHLVFHPAWNRKPTCANLLIPSSAVPHWIYNNCWCLHQYGILFVCFKITHNTQDRTLIMFRHCVDKSMYVLDKSIQKEGTQKIFLVLVINNGFENISFA